MACALVVASTGAALGSAPSRAVPLDTISQRVAACVVCHGTEGRATNGGYYPRIAGKPAGYLYNQLLNFRDGRRQNSTMAYLVDNLPDAYLLEMATYFAGLNLPYPLPQAATASRVTLESGRQLVMSGDKARKIPACSACHGKALTGVGPATPGLLGLPHAYLYAQLSSWKMGSRHAAEPDCMAEITKRLSMDDIAAAAAYLASQPVPGNASAAAVNPSKPPLECGSFTELQGAP